MSHPASPPDRGRRRVDPPRPPTPRPPPPASRSRTTALLVGPCLLGATAQLMVVLDATDREHRAALARRPTSASPTPTGSGSSPPTRWPSAVCCCSAAGSPTSSAASAPSSSGWSASPLPPRSAAPPQPGDAVRRPRAAGRLRRAAGAGGAVAADHRPSPTPKERGKAFGVFGAIAGGGAAIGLLLGGVLTEYASWRWCLYVNVPIAVVAVRRRRRARPREPGRPATARSTCPARRWPPPGWSRWSTASPSAETDGWSAPVTLALLVAAGVLLVAFVVDRAPGRAPAAAAARRARPQPRRLLPGAARRRRACSRCSCS